MKKKISTILILLLILFTGCKNNLSEDKDFSICQTYANSNNVVMKGETYYFENITIEKDSLINNCLGNNQEVLEQ